MNVNELRSYLHAKIPNQIEVTVCRIPGDDSFWGGEAAHIKLSIRANAEYVMSEDDYALATSQDGVLDMMSYQLVLDLICQLQVLKDDLIAKNQQEQEA